MYVLASWFVRSANIGYVCHMAAWYIILGMFIYRILSNLIRTFFTVSEG